MANAVLKSAGPLKATRVKASASLLAMFAERYLALESSDSSKMALEISTAWNCRPVMN